MKIPGIPPEFLIGRDDYKCIRCKVCENQCSFQTHHYVKEDDKMAEDDFECIGCQRCATLCPTNAIKIKKNL